MYFGCTPYRSKDPSTGHSPLSDLCLLPLPSFFRRSNLPILGFRRTLVSIVILDQRAIARRKVRQQQDQHGHDGNGLCEEEKGGRSASVNTRPAVCFRKTHPVAEEGQVGLADLGQGRKHKAEEAEGRKAGNVVDERNGVESVGALRMRTHAGDDALGGRGRAGAEGYEK